MPIKLVSIDEVYDADLGEWYTSKLFDLDGHSIEVTEDSHGYHAKAGSLSRINMDEGGLVGFFLDLFGLR